MVTRLGGNFNKLIECLPLEGQQCTEKGCFDISETEEYKAKKDRYLPNNAAFDLTGYCIPAELIKSAENAMSGLITFLPLFKGLGTRTNFSNCLAILQDTGCDVACGWCNDIPSGV